MHLIYYNLTITFDEDIWSKMYHVELCASLLLSELVGIFKE